MVPLTAGSLEEDARDLERLGRALKVLESPLGEHLLDVAKRLRGYAEQCVMDGKGK